MAVHKVNEAHHKRVSKLHKLHADALDDSDPHAAFHRAMAPEHEDMADFRHECAKAVAGTELPEVERFGPEGPRKAAVSALGRFEDVEPMAASAIAGVAKGHRMVLRGGNPTLQDLFAPTNWRGLPRKLPPELRKAII